MKPKSIELILAFLLITFLSCDNQSSKNKTAEHKFVIAHSLKTKTGNPIGNVYVKFLNDTIFTDLYIINQTDTLFTIKRYILSSKKGKEAEVYNKGFLGYKFVLKKDDYIVLSNIGENGAVSDDITIEWNYDSKIMELLKLP